MFVCLFYTFILKIKTRELLEIRVIRLMSKAYFLSSFFSDINMNNSNNNKKSRKREYVCVCVCTHVYRKKEKRN